MPTPRSRRPALALHLWCPEQRSGRRARLPPRRNYRCGRSTSSYAISPRRGRPGRPIPGDLRQTEPAPQTPQDPPPRTLVNCWDRIATTAHGTLTRDVIFIAATAAAVWEPTERYVAETSYRQNAWSERIAVGSGVIGRGLPASPRAPTPDRGGSSKRVTASTALGVRHVPRGSQPSASASAGASQALRLSANPWRRLFATEWPP